MVKSYLDLEVYQLAHKLAVEVHKMTLKELPKFEMYEEAGQLRRSSKSVSATIVEGYGRRRYKAEFVKFLVYSHASCDESIEHVKLLKDTESLAAARADYFLASYDKLGRKIYKFLEGVEREHRSED